MERTWKWSVGRDQRLAVRTGLGEPYWHRQPQQAKKDPDFYTDNLLFRQFLIWIGNVIEKTFDPFQEGEINRIKYASQVTREQTHIYCIQ